jgi:hypothetical protein
MSSTWEDISGALSGVLPLIGKLAPAIATAVGGPLAGAAVSALEGVLGLAPGAGAPAVAAALQVATPQQLADLKKADNDFKVQMARLGFDTTKLDFDDRASARNRESIVKDKTPSALAYILLVSVTVATGWILSGHTGASETITGTIVGFLFAELRSALAYYFGSSQGSDAKNVLLFNSQPVDK